MKIMEELQQIIHAMVSKAEKNQEPLLVDSCGCIFTDETCYVCPEHFKSIPNDW